MRLYKMKNKRKMKKEKQERLKILSSYANSFQLFKEPKPLEDVAIEFVLDIDTVLFYYEDIFVF